MKKISLQFAAILTMLFLFSFSCEDHVVPDTPQILPELETRPLIISANGKLRFKLAFKNLGNTPIASYGVAYSFASYDFNKPYIKDPTIEDTKWQFNKSPALEEFVSLEITAPEDYFAIYYRAYAILTNGKIVYGSAMEYKPDLGGRAVFEVFGSPNLSKPYNTGYVFKDTGTKKILEYGLVYSYNVAANQAINKTPTVADHKDVTDAKILKPAKELTVGISLAIPEPSINELYIRLYVIYDDQTVDYGKYTAHVKK